MSLELGARGSAGFGRVGLLPSTRPRKSLCYREVQRQPTVWIKEGNAGPQLLGYPGVDLRLTDPRRGGLTCHLQGRGSA